MWRQKAGQKECKGQKLDEQGAGKKQAPFKADQTLSSSGEQHCYGVK